VPVGEEFEFRDLSGSTFWGVDLQGSTFRDVNLSHARVSHAELVDVTIDGYVERLVVNGVDVTAHVHEHDRWHPLRGMIRAEDLAGMRAAWDELERVWHATIERARALPADARRRSVDGEWSFVETLRHLVFAFDKWMAAPVLGRGFAPIGIPNSGSRDFGWPGVDLDADPTFDEVLAVRADRSAQLRAFLDTADASDLDRTVDVLENGPSSVRTCVQVVFEEEFQHHRYAVRDLERL
jgi:uncharacterized protein YjbI with pentapeptide repeats